MLTRQQCFCISITSGEGNEAKSSMYYVMAENAPQAIAIVMSKGIDLGTNFDLFIMDEVAGFVEPDTTQPIVDGSAEGKNEDPISDASEIKLGTVGAVKMHAGHLMLFAVESMKDVLRNVTPDVVEVSSVWSENAALIF